MLAHGKVKSCPHIFSTLFIATFITVESRGDGKRSQQRVVEVNSVSIWPGSICQIHLTGEYSSTDLTSARNLCDGSPISAATSRQICQRLRGIIEIAPRGIDLDTELLRTHLSFPSPSWRLASRDIFITVPAYHHHHTATVPALYSLRFWEPTQCAMCNVWPRSTSTLSPSLLLCATHSLWDDLGPCHMFDHLWLTQSTALLPTAKTISWNLYLLQFLPTLLFFMYVVSSEGRSGPLQRHIK